MGDVVSGGELVVAVDFGTTNTVAVARREGTAPQVVSVDGMPYLPSAVFLGDDGRLVVGTDALRLGRSAPHRLEQAPKARLSEDTILLGDTAIDVRAAVRAVLSRVCAAAAQQAGAPVGHLVLTHPADWGPVRMGRLPRAAAGLAPRISLIPEPVAVAARAALPPGAAVLVVDLGGGTCDAAVVGREGAGYTVLACAGLPDLGGDDLDQRIVDWLDPASHELGTDVPTLRARLLMRQDARATKELLSRRDSAPLHAGASDQITLSRAKFEALVADDLARVVELAERVVASAGVDRTSLRSVHLVGGTSRIPRVAALLRSALELPVHPDPEPESTVAWGALELSGATESGSPTRPVQHQVPAAPGPIEPRPRSGRRGLVAAIAAVAVVLAVVAAGILIGKRQIDGEPTAAPGGSPGPTTTSASGGSAPQWAPEFPVVRQGKPVLGPQGPEPAVVPAGQSGIFQATGTYEGATETKVEVRFGHGAVADRPAPAGYRWVVADVVATLRAKGELQSGDGHNVYLADDRGQLVDSVNRAGAATVALCGSDQQDLPATPQGKSRTECAAFLVPVATTVRGVVYDDRGIDPLRTHALLFPVDLPATGTATLPVGDGRVGGTPLEVTTGTSERAEVVLADIIDTPSAYFADAKAPPGTSVHVVRYAVRASGISSVRPVGVATSLAVLDDRGLPIPTEDHIHFELRNCPEPPVEIPSGGTAQGCVVFVLSSHTKISRIAYQSGDHDDDPANWRIWELPG